MGKKIIPFLLIIILMVVFSSCSERKEKIISENEELNQPYIEKATDAMGDNDLGLQANLDWGMSYEQVKEEVDEPYISDDGQYLTRAFYASLPKDKSWADKNGNILADTFVSTDILSYYTVDSTIGLYEYGYLVPDVNLYQYDFLKNYYTKKFGKPAKEDWEFNNASHKASKDDDYHKLFSDGKVKVLTVWDIKALGSVLVIDWLNDPAQDSNNYGQISFYQRTDDFSVNDANDESNKTNE